jgi:hypothetical protein
MELEKADPDVQRREARVLGESAVAQIFALRDLGWGAKQIARGVGLARNTVRAWLRGGEDRRYGGEGRVGILDPYYFWIQSRFQGGIRNADLLQAHGPHAWSTTPTVDKRSSPRPGPPPW